MSLQATEIRQNKLLNFLKNFFQIPNSVALIVMLVLFAMIMSYFIPAGEYTRVKDVASGRMLIDPLTFHYVNANPANLLEFPMTLFRALTKAADIIFFCFMTGGCMEIILRTGALHAVTSRVVQALDGKEIWVIPILMGLFSIGGFSFGMSVEAIGFTPIIVRLTRKLGFDAITGVAIIILGCNVGFTAGLLNPSVGIAHAILHMPLYSGIGFRAVIEVTCLIITSYYVMRYARRVKNNPSKSIVANMPEVRTFEENDEEIEKLELTHYLVLAIMAVGFSVMIWGSFYKGWYLAEIGALFFTMGVLSGFVTGWGPSKVARIYVDGVKSMVFGVLIIGFARGILLVMEDTRILDTIIHSLAVWVGTLPSSIIVIGMFVFALGVSFVIVSASGMAVVTMPILGPLADILGVTRQTAVLMFQFSDGFTHNILPTSATTMSIIGMANIPYDKWMRFALPIFFIHMLLSVIFIYIAVWIQYS